jgi:hypothetical protein
VIDETLEVLGDTLQNIKFQSTEDECEAAYDGFQRLRNSPFYGVIGAIEGVAPSILVATLGGIMDGKYNYCSDRSAGTPTLTVSWTPLPSFFWFLIGSFSYSCCQYLVLDVIPLFNVDYRRLRSGRIAEGHFP